MKMITFLLFATFLFATTEHNSSLLKFYQHTLKTLHITQEAHLQSRSNALMITSKKINRFATINANIFYAKTKADQLQNSFNTSQITLSDTIDIFNKNAANIQLLHLNAKQNRFQQMAQKEKIFVLLVQMIGEYEKISWNYKADTTLLKHQKQFAKKLALAVKAGAKPRIEYERFLNLLTLLQSKIIQERSQIQTMQNSFKIYAPKMNIPTLASSTYYGGVALFLQHDPVLLLKKNQTRASTLQTKKLQESWLPNMILSANQQYDNDPTANGDNYSFKIAFDIHFNGGVSKRIEASHLQTILAKGETSRTIIEQKVRFLALVHTAVSAKKSLEILQPSILLAQKNLRAMQIAYLKRFIDFTSYIQTYQELLQSQSAYNNALYRYKTSVTLLNNLSQGTIYE